MARFLRAIRFDLSDTHVFPRAAEPDEWAIPGGFLYMPRPGFDAGSLAKKERQAFVSGFFGMPSFGFSTLVSVGEASEQDIETCVLTLTRFLVEHFGAPSRDAAEGLARDEIGYARALADDTPLNTLLAVKREVDPEGAVREQFHIVNPPGDKPHALVWDVVEDQE